MLYAIACTSWIVYGFLTSNTSAARARLVILQLLISLALTGLATYQELFTFCTLGEY